MQQLVYHDLLAFQCIYGCSDGGKNGEGKEGSEISGGGKRVKVDLLLVCRWLGFLL